MLKLILTFLSISFIYSFDHSINHFDTNLDRFAKGPSLNNIIPSRIILPNNFMEQILNKKEDKIIIKKEQNNNKLLNNQNSHQQINIKILTNPNIPLIIKNEIIDQNLLPFKNDFKIPQIIRGEDLRPIEEGKRLGQQNKFAGPTNQYKEDWGQKFTQKENQQIPSLGLQNGGIITQKIQKDINPNGSKIIVENKFAFKNNQNTQMYGQLNGQISPYLNSPEEITGSRWRSIDEYFNNKNKGNRGRGPNRFVKIDLLNE